MKLRHLLHPTSIEMRLRLYHQCKGLRTKLDHTIDPYGMLLASWFWNTETAFYPHKYIGGCKGDGPTSLPMFCGLVLER